MAVRTFALAVLACALAAPAGAQTALTLEDALRRAREVAAPIAIARARIAEAGSARADAAARFFHNPALEAQVGPRVTDGSGVPPDGRTTLLDAAISVSQQFETGGQQRARRALADAQTARAATDAEVVVRGVLLDAGERFLEALAAGERLAAAEAADETSRQLLAANERRYALGDIAAVDLNLTRIEAARTRAALATGRAEVAATLGRLRELLRLPAEAPLELRGSLSPDPPPPLDTLLAMVDSRPDLRRFDAEGREGEARVALGRGMTRPDIGIRAGYEREARDQVVRAGVTVTLPAFQNGASARAEGLAQAGRARLEQQTAREGAVIDVRTSHDVLLARQSAVADAGAMVPALDDNDMLARRSYEAGEMNLLDLLQLRREALALRDLLVELRLAAARERLHLDFLTGALQ